MLNEDKIKIMASIALFEKQKGKKIAPVNQYFRGDYVSHHLFRSFFSYLICYLLGTVVWLLYSFDDLMNIVSTDEILSMAEHYILFFVGGMFVYLMLSALVYIRRYNIATRENKIYLAKLKRLDKRYEFLAKSKELTKESKGGQSI